MAAQSNITVFDGAATPVSHTLLPIGVERDGDEYRAFWRENIPTVPVFANVRLTLTQRKLKSGVTRVAQIVEVPVMEAVAGNNAAGYTAAPKVAYVDAVHQVGYFSERSTVNSRRLARMISVNLGNNIAVTAAAATTGFVPDLFDSLINPS